jgi:predicted metal-dependent hydrolase
MELQITLGDILVDVVRKDIKNVHLSVRPPNGRVRISAPKRMSIATLRVFAISKLDWIKRQQAKLREQTRETPREYVDRESHSVWGTRYLLSVREEEAKPTVRLDHQRIVLTVRPGSGRVKREAVMDEWHRTLLHDAVPELIRKWESRLGVEVADYFLQRMKTRWGSCNPRTRRIRLNTELVKKPADLMEYVVVHEMIHLIEPSHNQRFVTLMSRHYPTWREARAALNALPLGAAAWRW